MPHLNNAACQRIESHSGVAKYHHLIHQPKVSVFDDLGTTPYTLHLQVVAEHTRLKFFVVNMVCNFAGLAQDSHTTSSLHVNHTI